MEKTKLLTVKEYVALLQKRGIETSTDPKSLAVRIYRLIKEEGFPYTPYGLLGRSIRINPVEADAWIEERSKKLV